MWTYIPGISIAINNNEQVSIFYINIDSNDLMILFIHFILFVYSFIYFILNIMSIYIEDHDFWQFIILFFLSLFTFSVDFGCWQHDTICQISSLFSFVWKKKKKGNPKLKAELQLEESICLLLWWHLVYISVTYYDWWQLYKMEFS